jgi:transposase
LSVVADKRIIAEGVVESESFSLEAAMDGRSTQSRKAAVRLDAQQRLELEQCTRNGVGSAKQILHARILLLADAEHALGRYTDEQIGKSLGIASKTVARVRERFVRGGLKMAVERKRRPYPPIAPKLDGKAEAELVALCCSQPPAGRARWTMSLLADAMVERKIVVSIGRETVRTALKKMNCSPGGSNATASPNVTAPASWPRWRRCLTSTPHRSRKIAR